jgi:hypothetical protein
MANIVRTPSAGQPIDATYLLELANAINTLASNISTSPTMKLTSINTPSAGVQTVKTSEAAFIGGYVEVSSGNVAAGTAVKWDYSFPSYFKYPPVVTATPISVSGADAGTGVSVMIKSVGQNLVSGTVTFAGTGNLTVGLNLIIVGIPN